MSLAKLSLLTGQVVAGRETLAYHNPTKGVPEQLKCGSRRSAQPLAGHRHQGGDHDPLPTPLSCGIVANRSTADLNPQLIQRRLGLAEAQRKGTAQ